MVLSSENRRGGENTVTREEAIETLKLLKPNMRFDNSGWLYTKQAIEMAIKALKSMSAVMEVIKAHMDGEDKNTKAVLSDIIESVNELETFEQEPCDDAISRDAVIAWFCNQRCGCGCVDRKSCPILVGIRELPSVTQKESEE